MKRMQVGFALVVTFAVGLPPAEAGLVVTQTSDVVAGKNQYLATTTGTSAFDWNTFFPAGTTFTTGQALDESQAIIASSLSYLLGDGTQNTITAQPSLTNRLVLNNHLDGWPNFDGPGGTPVADLALNSELFDLTFGSGHRTVGFAIQTGTFKGNPDSGGYITNATGGGNQPAGVDFTVTAYDAGGAVVGSGAFSLRSGGPGVAEFPDIAWVTLTSDVPFRKLEVREVGPDNTDQYFSNILVSFDSSAAVPEPSSVALVLSAVFGVVGRRCVRRRAANRPTA